MTEYEVIIGLETHIQLNTATKAFCGCKADSWGEFPNTNICPTCSGQPGALPSTNKAMVEKSLMLCLAVNADINMDSFFDRKNYLYADLPGGYQITQNDKSIGRGGYLDFLMEDGREVRCHIHNLHMEEDAGKTKNEGDIRLIDMNRCGVPLVEMVTMPDLHSADEAAIYLMRLRQLLRWLGISEANMEKAHLRCDANVSIRPKGATALGKKCEIKNINSIEAVRTAINFEIERQIRETEAGNRIEQWTIEWDNDAQELRKMRSKETAADYRYFREPNLMPVHISKEFLEEVKARMPELPIQRCERFINEMGLPKYDATVLTAERDTSEFFEAACKAYTGDNKRVSNWMMNDVLRIVNEKEITVSDLKITAQDLADIIKMVDTKTINTSTGKKLVDLVQDSGKHPKTIVEEQGLGLVSDDSAIREICAKIVANNPKETASYRGGKETLIGWFVGQVMREMRGKADPEKAKLILEEILKAE
ncbi:MAG: Asp-tRNA(Asn)/Glu-tRNA(Gln) amidotransferase subunit GatB [Flexilinea sp.]